MIDPIEYMAAKIYALSSQLHFHAGHTHPFYEYARKELAYIINEIAKRPARQKGVVIARGIRHRMENETDENLATKTFVDCISSAQAYRLAQAAWHYCIELKTAYELENEEEEDEDEEEDYE